MISILAEQYATRNTKLYDLGCSLGAVTFLLQQLKLDNCSIVAVDNSSAMIDSCRASLAHNKAKDLLPVELRCEDIQKTELSEASVVVLNFTLQFIAPEQRDSIIKKIYDDFAKPVLQFPIHDCTGIIYLTLSWDLFERFHCLD